nr:hypothetical protein [uncultured Flavobacterium sp.]
MPLIPEFTIAIALGGILVLYILFRFLNSRPGYLGRKNDILDGFQSLRSKSIKLQESLSVLILSNNFAQELLAENFTYKDFLKQLQKNHIQNLSDKNYARIKNTHNRVVLMQAKKMLTEQEIILQDAEARLKKVL